MNAAADGRETAGVRSFAYEAQNALGQIFRGTLEAESAAEVQGRLGTLSLRVVSVEAETGRGRRRGRALSADDFQAFNQQLAHLTKAGLPVERGLRLIALDQRSGRLARATEAVAKELESGAGLQQAFDKHAREFPALYGKFMQAGVATGNLPGMLFNLGRHLELMARLRRDLWRTLSYPIMVLGALSLILLFISLIVLPRFSDIYGDFRTNLPEVTQVTLAVGHVYPYVFMYSLLAAIALVLATVVMKIAGVRVMFWRTLALRVPLIGPGLKANLMARWLDAVRMGVESGLDLLRAMEMGAEAAGGAGLNRETRELGALLAQGKPLSEFRGRFIPATVPTAIELGSATGDLAGTLLTLSRMYEQQAEFRLRSVPSVLTPILMMFIGSAIGLCIIGLFMPVIKLIQSVSGGDMAG